jgi:hypothetical protein
MVRIHQIIPAYHFNAASGNAKVVGVEARTLGPGVLTGVDGDGSLTPPGDTGVEVRCPLELRKRTEVRRPTGGDLVVRVASFSLPASVGDFGGDASSVLFPVRDDRLRARRGDVGTDAMATAVAPSACLSSRRDRCNREVRRGVVFVSGTGEEVAGSPSRVISDVLTGMGNVSRKDPKNVDFCS